MYTTALLVRVYQHWFASFNEGSALKLRVGNPGRGGRCRVSGNSLVLFAQFFCKPKMAVKLKFINFLKSVLFPVLTVRDIAKCVFDQRKSRSQENPNLGFIQHERLSPLNIQFLCRFRRLASGWLHPG